MTASGPDRRHLLSPASAFADMSIGAKVMLAPLVALLVLGGLAIAGGFALDRQRAIIVSSYEESQPRLARALTLPLHLAEVKAGLYKLALWESLDVERDEIESTILRIRHELGEAGGDIEALQRNGVPHAETLTRAFEDYRESVESALVIIEEDPVQGAAAVREGERLFDELARRSRSLSARTVSDFRARTNSAEGTARRVKQIFLLVALVASLLVLALGMFLSRAIALPVRMLVIAIRNLRRRRLEDPIPMVERGDEMGEVARAVARFRAVLLDRKRLEDERERQRAVLDHMAHHDPLTGLPNRQAMQDFLAKAFADRRGGRLPLALLVLDLDGFKPANDTYGHAAGDAVLQEIGRRLASVTREGDLAVRLGGDEFGVVLSGLKSREHVERLASRVAGLFAKPVQWEGRSILIGASIGGALTSDTGADVDALMAAADGAMYAAKSDSHVAWKIHPGGDAAGGSPGGESGQQLEQAIRDQQIVAFYQPVVRLGDGGHAGYAIHLRWNDPDRGLVPIGDLLPAVERAGLGGALAMTGFRQLLRTVAGWLEEGLEPGQVSVVPPQAMLTSLPAMQDLDWLLAEFPQAATRLVIEVPEHYFDARSERLILGNLERLSARGLHAAIGGFGARGGALALLARAGLGETRISSRLVAGIGTDRGSEQLIAAVLDFSAGLGIDVFARGVKTPEQEGFLRERGCRFATGPRYGEALAAETARARIRGHGNVTAFRSA